MTASDYQNLVKLCQALDEHRVEYLVFGSTADVSKHATSSAHP